MADITKKTDKTVSATNSSTFGISKDLSVPITIKIKYLQSVNTPQLQPSLEKYANPEIFKETKWDN